MKAEHFGVVNQRKLLNVVLIDSNLTEARAEVFTRFGVSIAIV